MKKVSLILAITAVIVAAFTITLTNSTVKEGISNYVIKDAQAISEELKQERLEQTDPCMWFNQAAYVYTNQGVNIDISGVVKYATCKETSYNCLHGWTYECSCPKTGPYSVLAEYTQCVLSGTYYEAD